MGGDRARRSPMGLMIHTEGGGNFGPADSKAYLIDARVQ